MNNSPLSMALRAGRDTLAARWCRRVGRRRPGRRSGPIAFDRALALAIIDELATLLEAGRTTRIPLRHNADAFRRLGEFPRNVACCIEIFEAGEQVIGAFVAENAGADGPWSRSERNRFLGEIDAVFHVLVHREIQGLCEYCLHEKSSRTRRPADAGPGGSWPTGGTTGRSIICN